jgi:opacity protein-like surface antigen
MRLIISGLAAAVVLAGFAASASAQGNTKPRNYDKYDRYERYEAERDWRDAPFFRLFPGYQARNPDNFRYGSDAWWRSMDREGRGGYSRP